MESNYPLFKGFKWAFKSHGVSNRWSNFFWFLLIFLLSPIFFILSTKPLYNKLLINIQFIIGKFMVWVIFVFQIEFNKRFYCFVFLKKQTEISNIVKFF